MEELYVCLERSATGYGAFILGVDGIVSCGESIDETKSMITEAIDFYKEYCIEEGIKLPDALCGEYKLKFFLLQPID